ncbi:MAG: hypothetical protein CME71_03425 [Halobacteriovorax sp.]|nr:hypothetical protein [Halobacteriovorax sp.]|tara:strand:- start:1380 stop:1649 length:270 start_codon:yes stop_codon:yes gene_type:complete
MNPQSECLPARQGKLAKDTQGNLVLINEGGKAFAVDNDLSTIWLMLDGQKTYSEILETLSQEAPYTPSEIDPMVSEVLEKLKAAELVVW